MAKKRRANVVSLRGQPIVPPGQPNPQVIALAQDALDRAKSCDNTFGIIGTLERLKHVLLHE